VSIGTWLGETLEPPAIVVSESPVATQKGKSIAVPRAKASPEAVDWVGDGTTASLTRVPEGYVPTRRLASASDNSPMEAPEVGQRVSHEPTPDSATAEVDTAPPTATPLSWQALVFLAWIAIALALLLLLIQRAWFVRGLIAQAQESPPRLRIALDQCRVQMGVKRAVPIRVSSNATSPAVCGLFRPSILIPKGLVPRLQPHDLQAVLLHELAHIKRGDLWVNLTQTLLQVIYFYNPFLWLANLVIRRAREQAVDEAVLVALREAAHDYPETLLNVAKLAFKQRPALSLRLIGVVESKSALRSRIKHILARPFPQSAKLGLASLIAIVAIGAVLLPMARAERHGMYVKGIDEILHVSDGTGHLTIQSLHMPAPDGKRPLEMNETFLRVRVENTSP
jgi:beta-lactamase regulating signal transducer with metallopeptidase domain